MKTRWRYDVRVCFAGLFSAVILCSLAVADGTMPARKGVSPAAGKCLRPTDGDVAPAKKRIPPVMGKCPRQAVAAGDLRRVSIWVDLCRAEPLPFEAVLDDLAGAGVIYVGEQHRLVRHHDVQAAIVEGLAKRNVSLVLGLEQMEACNQKDLDRYCRGEIDFDEMAEATQWGKRWGNYRQYRSVLEAARKAGGWILGLNAKSRTIRQVARSGGLAKLDADLRRELPDDVWLDDPVYEQLLNLRMPAMRMATAKRLRPMMEAQMCRDAMMASVLCSFLKSEQGKGRVAVVLCGSGHASYGLGTAARVRRRMPDIKERIVLMTTSGDTVLSAGEKKMSRPTRVTHEQLRKIGRPIADYLQVTSLRPNSD